MTFTAFSPPIRRVLLALTAICLAFAVLLAPVSPLASAAGAQGDDGTATIGGEGCDGDNVELTVESMDGEVLLTENVAPIDGGIWQVTVAIPALDAPVIASAICFAGDVALVNYSPVSIRIQPGVEVGGIIELPGTPVDGAVATPDDPADAADSDDAEGQPDELPHTGPFTVPFTALAIAMIAAGLGMAYVSRQQRNTPSLARISEREDQSWPTSHWDS